MTARSFTGYILRNFLSRALLWKRRGFWLTWLWRAPVLRCDHPSMFLCTCDGPIFVRNAKTDAYQCEFCGGGQHVDGYNYSNSAPFIATRRLAFVSLGIDYKEGARLIHREIDSHVVAMGSSYADLAARLAVARGESRRSLHSYMQWCTHVSSQSTFFLCDTSNPRNVSDFREKVSIDDLRRAVYALRFALAVYALPYEQGYFYSVWRMLQLQTMWHRRCVQAVTEDQVASIHRILSGKRRDPLLEVAYARYSLRLGQPCFAVFLDHRMRRVVIAFRGTLSVADVVADVASGYTTVRLGNCRDVVTSRMEEVCTHVPQGLYVNVMEAGTHIMPALDIICQQHSDYAIMCVGHSLGAMEAILFHLLFFCPTHQGKCMRTIAFAPAPCVDCVAVPKLNELLGEEAITSWVYGLDGVARLQLHSLTNLFYPSFSSDLTRLERVPMFSIPGRLLHMLADSTDVIEVPVDASWRNQLIVRRDALLHHFPMAYSTGLYRSLLAHEEQRSVKVTEEAPIQKD